MVRELVYISCWRPFRIFLKGLLHVIAVTRWQKSRKVSITLWQIYLGHLAIGYFVSKLKTHCTLFTGTRLAILNAYYWILCQLLTYASQPLLRVFKISLSSMIVDSKYSTGYSGYCTYKCAYCVLPSALQPFVLGTINPAACLVTKDRN